MQQSVATQSGELDSLDMDAEHVMPPELPTQDSALYYSNRLVGYGLEAEVQHQGGTP